MKLTSVQIDAASIYWTQILTGKHFPNSLRESMSDVTPVFHQFLMPNRQETLTNLKMSNPNWQERFTEALTALLQTDEAPFCLELDYKPEGLLKQAANNADIPETLFPLGKLTMYFSEEGDLIVGTERIDAQEFIEELPLPNCRHK